MEKIKVLLYSGGMDSWLIEKLWKPDYSMYCVTGGKYSAEEISHCNFSVKGRGIVNYMDLSRYEREDFIIPYRNVYLCLAALNEVERKWPLEQNKESSRVVEICLGATAGDRVLDKSLEFAERLSGLLTYLSSPQHWTGGNSQTVEIVLPYKGYTKRQLLREYCDKYAGASKPYESRKEAMAEAWSGSFSCYTPNGGTACGKCKPCVRKTVAFALEGFRWWPMSRYVADAREYLEKSGILDQIREETYGRAEEEKDILEFMEVTSKW